MRSRRSTLCTRDHSRPPVCARMLELRTTLAAAPALRERCRKTASSEVCHRAPRGTFAAGTQSIGKIRRDIVIRPATQPCLKGHGGNGPTVSVKAEAGLAEPAEPDSAESAGKQQPQKRGTRRTAPLPAWAMRSAHCPLRPGHCLLHQRIVRMRITPPQCGLCPERNTPRCCCCCSPRATSSCSNAPRCSSQLVAPSAISTRIRSLFLPLALALSSDDDPPLSALLSAFALCHHLHRPRSTPRFRQALRAAYTRAVTPVELGFGLAVMHLRCACSFSSAARPRSQQ